MPRGLTVYDFSQLTPKSRICSTFALPTQLSNKARRKHVMDDYGGKIIKVCSASAVTSRQYKDAELYQPLCVLVMRRSTSTQSGNWSGNEPITSWCQRIHNFATFDQLAINSSLQVVISTGNGVVKIFHPRNATVNQMYSVPPKSVIRDSEALEREIHAPNEIVILVGKETKRVQILRRKMLQNMHCKV